MKKQKTGQAVQAFKKLIAVLIVAMLAATMLAAQDIAKVHAYESAIFSSETRHFSTATIDDDFEDNIVIVSFNKETSFKFNEITPLDFPNLHIRYIIEVNKYTTKIVQEQVIAESMGTASISDRLIENDIYRRTIAIKLYENCKQGVLDAIQILIRYPNIISAHPNYISSLRSVATNDPGFNDASFFNDYNTGRAQWGLNGEHGIDAHKAWGITTGSNEVIVGIIDTGIRATHQDLVVDEYLSRDFNFTDPTGHPIIDEDGHGTQIAGIIGAQTNTARGMSGINWDVTLVSLRVIYNAFLGIMRAIDYATSTFKTDRPISILNFSLGLPDEIPGWRRAILAYPGLFVTAAANSIYDNPPRNHDIILDWPTDYNRDPEFVNGRDNVISVSATNWYGHRASFAYWGQESVGIFAPGQDILTTCHTGDSVYRRVRGTSFAVPHVVGAAALMWSVNPLLEPRQLKSIMINTGTIFNTTQQQITPAPQGRILNAYRAVRAAKDLASPLHFTRIGATPYAQVSLSPNSTFDQKLIIPHTIHLYGIPLTVTTIAPRGFSHFLGHSILFPHTLQYIGYKAFHGVSNLSAIYNNSPTPITISSGTFTFPPDGEITMFIRGPSAHERFRNAGWNVPPRVKMPPGTPGAPRLSGGFNLIQAYTQEVGPLIFERIFGTDDVAVRAGLHAFWPPYSVWCTGVGGWLSPFAIIIAQVIYIPRQVYMDGAYRTVVMIECRAFTRLRYPIIIAAEFRIFAVSIPSSVRYLSSLAFERLTHTTIRL
ncbi:MAG: S8 family serine peptidase [Firmicutes bacterium]|nr:S8 family serine peptidase [Bacillota bacterium]